LEPGRCSAAWRCRRTPRRGRERASTARVVAGRHRIASTSRNEFPPRREEPESPGRDMRCRRRVALGQAGRRSVAASQALLPLGSLGRDGDGMARAARPRSSRPVATASDRPGRRAGGARARASVRGAPNSAGSGVIAGVTVGRKATGEEPSRQHSCRAKCEVNELEILSF